MSSSERRERSNSRSHTSRPTTPLRPSSRSSFRDSARNSVTGDASFPLNTFEPAFAELSDAMADLEANLMHFQLMHESLARFSESFASFLYGLNMNAFCVDFPEGPVPESFKRSRAQEEPAGDSRDKTSGEMDGETTFMCVESRYVIPDIILTHDTGQPTLLSSITRRLLPSPPPSSRHRSRKRHPAYRRRPIPEAVHEAVVGRPGEAPGLAGWPNREGEVEFDEVPHRGTNVHIEAPPRFTDHRSSNDKT